MSTDSPDDIRRRLGEISDELRGLADDDFAGKYTLNKEADELRSQLEEFDDDTCDTKARWADRSARKGSHSVDYELEAQKARLIQSGEGGT